MPLCPNKVNARGSAATAAHVQYWRLRPWAGEGEPKITNDLRSDVDVIITVTMMTTENCASTRI